MSESHRSSDPEKERQWLTRGEIVGLIAGESESWRSEVRKQHEKQDQLADRLLDGAQASLNTALILTGNEAFGVKGALPEIRERLKALEDAKDGDRQTFKDRSDLDDGRWSALDARIGTVEANQHTIRKRIGKVFAYLTDKGSDGEAGWKKIAVYATILGVALNVLSKLLPSWVSLKVFAAKFALIVSRLGQ